MDKIVIIKMVNNGINIGHNGSSWLKMVPLMVHHGDGKIGELHHLVNVKTKCAFELENGQAEVVDLAIKHCDFPLLCIVMQTFTRGYLLNVAWMLAKSCFKIGSKVEISIVIVLVGRMFRVDSTWISRMDFHSDPSRNLPSIGAMNHQNMAGSWHSFTKKNT